MKLLFGDDVAEPSDRGDHADVEAAIDFGAQIVDVNVDDVGLGFRIGKDLRERVLSGDGGSAVLIKEREQGEFFLCQSDLFAFIICDVIFRVQSQGFGGAFSLGCADGFRLILVRHEKRLKKFFDQKGALDRIIFCELLRGNGGELIGIAEKNGIVRKIWKRTFRKETSIDDRHTGIWNHFLDLAEIGGA